MPHFEQSSQRWPKSQLAAEYHELCTEENHSQLANSNLDEELIDGRTDQSWLPGTFEYET